MSQEPVSKEQYEAEKELATMVEECVGKYDAVQWPENQ